MEPLQNALNQLNGTTSECLRFLQYDDPHNRYF